MTTYCTEVQPSWSSMYVTLLVRLKSPMTKRAALRWTSSIFLDFRCVLGSQVEAAKSTVGLTNEGGINSCFNLPTINVEHFWFHHVHRALRVRTVCNRQPRLLNLILLNLIVGWPMGAAIVRPPNTKYTQSIGVCLEKLPKIV